MKRHPLLFLLLPLIAVWLASCAEESDCSMAGRATLRGSMLRMNDTEGGTPTDTTLAYLTVTALSTDSVLLNADTDVRDVFLPLRYTEDATVWVFHYNAENLSQDTDTIWIRHSNTPVFVSMDCGYDMKQSIINEEGSVRYTTYRLQSVNITSLSVSTNGTKNLELLY
jgi:hypothetical protein